MLWARPQKYVTIEKESDILSKPEGYGLGPPLPDLPQVQERWGVVLHTCTLSTGDVEAGGLL